jgi:hypothetical protein
VALGDCWAVDVKFDGCIASFVVTGPPSVCARARSRKCIEDVTGPATTERVAAVLVAPDRSHTET